MEEYQGLVSQPLDSENCGHTDVWCLSSGIPDTVSQVPVYFGPPLLLLRLRSDQMKLGVSTKM